MMMRAGLSAVPSRIVLARVRLARASRRHQPQQLRCYHHHVVAVSSVLRAHARPIRHVAVYVDRVRGVHRVQGLELDLNAVAILNLCEQIAGNEHGTPLLLALRAEETRHNFRDGIYTRRGTRGSYSVSLDGT